MQTISFIGQGIKSWSQLIPLINEALYPSVGALNLHSNSLDQIEPSLFQFLTTLKKLDLSSNNVLFFNTDKKTRRIISCYIVMPPELIKQQDY